MIEMKCDFGDPGFERQIALANIAFVWMSDLGNSLDCVALYYQVDDGVFFKVLEIKMSEIEGGWRLSTCCDFAVEEMITLHLGRELDPNKNSIHSISKL